MPRCVSICLLAGLTFAGAEPSFAQRITVQQPVFEVFSVGTTVSVPDRGGAHLGSVSRAGASRRSFGPFVSRPGSSVGLFREHSGISAHVWIHDLEAMDRLLLEQAESANPALAGPRLDEYAEHAFNSLVGRQPERFTGRAVKTPATPARLAPGEPAAKTQAAFRASKGGAASGGAAGRSGRDDPSLTRKAAHYHRLGLRAEERGQRAIAQMYFRLAAKYGFPQGPGREDASD